MSLRIPGEQNALLVRARTLEKIGLSAFVVRHAVSAAQAVIAQAERVILSDDDSLRVLARTAGK